jgi:hypothetical protein
MNFKRNDSISGLVSAAGDTIKEIDELAQVVDGYHHKPLINSTGSIKMKLKDLIGKMLEIKNDIKAYIANEGIEDSSLIIISRFKSGIRGYINTPDDGDIAHMHIIFHKSKKNICVELENPEYYDHDQSMDSILTAQEKEELVELLNSPLQHKRFDNAGITIWDYALLTWNLNNPDKEVPDDIEIPDYTKL